MNNLDLAVHFFFQLAVILVVCRLVGIVAVKFGQPQVVAEMIAGVFLGPSLFGLLLPDWQQWLFPWDKTQTTRDTQSYLFPASQLGLALVLATLDNNWSQAIWNIGGGIGFVALAYFVIKPLLARIERAFIENDSLTDGGLAIGLALMALGAWWTDFLHLHAVFAEGNHHGTAVCHAGDHGRNHNAHGVAAIRIPRWARKAVGCS